MKFLYITFKRSVGILRRVTITILSRYLRNIKRWIRKQKLSTKVLVILCVSLLLSYAWYMNTRRLSVDPASYTPLMSLIGTIESNDNYNAYFGNPRNHEIKFTDMTIDEVMRWQADFIADGNASSAVGRYQIISTTLAGLVRELNINTNEKFSQQMQDRMAIALFERRGSTAFINKEMTAEEFATSLAKEWAALPKISGKNPNNSYYASDGLNKALTTPDKVLARVRSLQPK
jgi:muramidase (phage lysozyme)